ncbi:hypothetical protein LTR66_017883, partial [Elasticomyces elasticus]
VRVQSSSSYKDRHGTIEMSTLRPFTNPDVCSVDELRLTKVEPEYSTAWQESDTEFQRALDVWEYSKDSEQISIESLYHEIIKSQQPGFSTMREVVPEISADTPVSNTFFPFAHISSISPAYLEISDRTTVTPQFDALVVADGHFDLYTTDGDRDSLAEFHATTQSTADTGSESEKENWTRCLEQSTKPASFSRQELLEQIDLPQGPTVIQGNTYHAASVSGNAYANFGNTINYNTYHIHIKDLAQLDDIEASFRPYSTNKWMPSDTRSLKFAGWRCRNEDCSQVFQSEIELRKHWDVHGLFPPSSHYLVK